MGTSPKEDLNTREEITPVGISMSGEVFDLYCPACGHIMIDAIFEEKGIEYPMKQCPICLTIYLLGSEKQEGAKDPQDVILAPLSKEFLQKHKKQIRGTLPGSW